MAANPIIKRTAITRAGYEYQDLVGIEILIDHFRDPGLYEWVQLESDDAEFKSLDDVVALRKDASIEFVQVKFTVNSDENFLDWDWLLEAKGKGSSMLSKWAKSYFRAKSQGRVHRARLVTNRVPSPPFAACLDGALVDLGRISEDMRGRIDSACGGSQQTEEFLSEFEFAGEQLDLDRYEEALRDKLVPTDTDSSGWLLLRTFVRRWAIQKNDPQPDGKILREHLVQLITKRRPQPISQEFYVPPGYQVPSQSFDETVRARIAAPETPITILWGTPGRGKSTYLSDLTQKLQCEDEVVLRHHYFLSSDGPRANRMSYSDIAVSIIDQLLSRYPDVVNGIAADVDKLHADLGAVAAKLAKKGKRLYLVIDGLDHVWRDTLRTDQLEFLFNALLPLPANVSLIVGTQRVPDAQLPGRLLASAKDADWIEVPRMDESAVHRWLEAQDTARPLILSQRDHRERGEELADIAAALFRVSQGHPLHLIYALEGLVRTGKEISTDDIDALPPCPDGDIRSYYRALWVKLPVTARNILHALAGSDFFWPDLGIRQCLGDYSEIDFLLEPRNAGMIPFHQSIFAYVREMPDHGASYAALLPKIVLWLETQAPEYWRWGWLWLAQAETGNFKPLFEGANRDWVVSSLAAGWPERQIARILSTAESAAFEQGDLPQTVRLRSLKTRVLNARDFQSGDYGQFRATALTTSDNRQQTLNLIDDLQELSPDEIVSIARLSPATLRTEVATASLNELGRRVNAWIELRHKPEHEFRELSDRLLSAAAFAGASAVPRTLRYLMSYRNPAPHCDTYINLLGTAQDIEALLAVRKRMRGAKSSRQRRLIQEHILRAALFKGANPRPLISDVASDLTPFTASWLIRTGVTSSTRFHASPPPEDLLRDRYSVGSDPELSQYFYDFFWSALCISLQAVGDFSLFYPSRDSDKLGWLESALRCLEDLARGIAAGNYPLSYSAVFVAADALKSLDHVGPNDRSAAQFRAFRHSLPNIALDLHLLGLADQHQPEIATDDFNRARKTLHWINQLWIEQNIENQLPLLEAAAANTFIEEASAALAGKVSEFNERSDQWTKLARLASLYNVQDPAALMLRAADCLVGYGWRKDLGAMDMLDAIQQVHGADASRTKEWIFVVSPIINEITEFTDGDETNHVRSELIDVVCTTMPEYLAGFYAHHVSQDEWRYADETLEAALSTIDLSSRAAAALSGTLLDDRMLRGLEKRGESEPIARSLLQKQVDFLARSEPKASATEPKTEELRPEEEKALQQDPTAIPPGDFKALVRLVSGAFPYRHRGEFLGKWLSHWQAQGKASIALNSIRTFFDNEDRYSYAEEILDHAFKVCLAEEGKDAAYPWLVKAHIYRHGWQSNWTSEKEVMERLTLAAQTYPERWQEFIRATSAQTPYYQRRGKDFVLGYQYLVRYLLLVGQTGIATAVTDEFVKTLVSEVRDQPISGASWLRMPSGADLALELLFERLNWPVPMVRWRAAKEIRNLLNDPATMKNAGSLLLDRLEACRTESETCSLLTIIFLTDPAGQPSRADVADRLHKPSALSDALLHQIYATDLDPKAWSSAHSGEAPGDFEPDGYFEEHKTAHVPPILSNNLGRLEARIGKPFLRQWAYEWKQLRERLDTRFTRYPYYFDDVGEVRGGIVGQYLQRQNEIYRSAYLRVFALAVDLWGMPAKLAAEYCSDNAPAIAGLFELEPGKRPDWLADIPERFLAAEPDFKDVVLELVKAGEIGSRKMVSLSTPFRKDAALYGHLSVTAFFVTDDFKLSDDRDLYEPSTILPLSDYFDPRGRQLALPEDSPAQEGAEGEAVPVCETLLPIPFGYWQSDYYSRGLSVPASYWLPEDAVLQCGPSALELSSVGSPVASTQIWHDDWTPRYPRGGHTRCGVVSYLDASLLSKAQTESGLRLGWFVERSVWTRESDYGDFELERQRAIVIEQP
ncbi:NACHT domain-containing protein [Rhodopseudomonas palustris]|uniref:NACHT domain-containing protein n=1 Tax=Rhodopseudomonas palustris TaxID=1076 RepID=UPI000DA18B6B|nr:NACHT domain-containing protein [Rhodopseudomonas palustris]